MPAEDGERHEKSNDIGHDDEPPWVTQRPTDFASGYFGWPNAAPGGRAEPDHRAAKTHGVSEVAPVVAALFQRERGEGNVVEHSGDEAEPERRRP